MRQDNILWEWANAHVFYNIFARKTREDDSLENQLELDWRRKVITESPNGKLLIDNSFFRDLKNKNKIYLAHITSNLSIIKKTKVIYSSGGCLIGSIYCAPITNDGNRLRIHNLGKYILEKEAPIITKEDFTPDVLVFEFELDLEAHNNLIGIDYLRLGKIHFEIYKDLEYLLSSNERFNLYQTILSKVKKSLDFLILCSDFRLTAQDIDPDEFSRLLIHSIQNLSILGYLYFEVVSEYLMLYQDSNISKKYSDLGEFYNPVYKDLMYSLRPDLKGDGKLSSFSPSFEELISYAKANKIFKHLNTKHFKEYLTERLLYLINLRLFNLEEELIDWRKFEWSFENLALKAKKLVGHLIHRELRNFGRYPSFYFYFDQTKALQIWNYWNHMDIAIPFNGVFPKGEVGINPAYPDLNYKIYLGKVTNDSQFSYVDLEDEIDLSIEPRLVDLRHTQMRINALPSAV
ncbi:hypothetical protein A2962_00330 [Candidatus Woesebacteria bacterium RIFCSPLOWO2_01_FULL_39_61]|uniref:Uncharacterized protein n=1 Tax=Candidatus Woesebacteria bacterium RIFCSPHIGHO2_02_FULL_39_13 TaxID=1802505 RepID=A0A1F7YZF6_9BACT|nr:MAG: hypothetical protein A2692_05540 [Candidatus Woesebacteria bacterium RIFCSPHIGHO2_01_FULL_39_95]OGM32736.1 MAG: hypothetical protein A3D01_01010 [Candidatus Woesebacteria bacterium RIFCSPHIGHO2_02_FULL_39_13]OGM37909.1 MAG: hypothetical protein A3E13_04360 [Candidatus Woesebacteria bacterium RIFCSPHIGHO2_12_FULL_40_20]OGM66339.1 MAG: hypothetical protein A2962_00330 [Candidatus Woesebacteria bacterium RIFCSPLOWO2_01_FULL_39_61]